MAKKDRTEKPQKEEKKEAKPAPAKKQAKPAAKQDDSGIRGIVRIAGKDMTGHLKLNRAIMRIKGVGHSLRFLLAGLITKELDIPSDVQVGSLTDEQIEKIDKIFYGIDAKKIPAFLMNRNKDFADGTNMHVIMNDLQFALRQDLENKKRNRTWQGWRHLKGQKVRGQRTKNTGRTGMAMGVMKVKAVPGAAPAGAAAPAAKQEKK